MNADVNRDEVEQILTLLELDGREQARDYCKQLVVSCEALFQVVLAGRFAGLHPYVYDCHFSEYDPRSLSPEDRDLTALAANGIIPLHRRATRAVRKVACSHEIPGLFAAHLLYTPSHRHWHLFCFDHAGSQHATGCIRPESVRYSRPEFVSSPLSDIWRQVCRNASVPPSVRIRCDRRPRRSDRVAEGAITETA